MASRTFTLTDKRIAALRWLQDQGQPVYVSYLAECCVPRTAAAYGGARGYSAQQATRTGAGYARPLAEAGLVTVKWTTFGWGTVQISDQGRRVLQELDAGRTAQSAEVRNILAAARDCAGPAGYYWWWKHGRV